MANFGALAGGMAAGIESGQRMRLQRERDTRDSERHQFDMGERQRTAETRDRQEAAWDELNAAIARRMQKQAPTQMPTQQPPATTSTGEAIDQGNGVQTMPLPDDGAGIQTRTLPETPGAAPGFTPLQSAPADVGLTRTPAPAASQPQAPRQGDDAGKQIGFSLYQNPNLLKDPEFLNEAAGIFMKARMPEGVKWLERSFKVQQENGIDAMKAFLAGDAQAGIQAFNSAGREKIESAQPITEGPNKGKWELRAQGVAQPMIVDPGAALRSFLDPKAYFELANKERDDARAAKKDDVEAGVKGAQGRYYDAQAKAVGDNAASLADYRRQTGAAAVTRANTPKGTGANTDRQRAQLSNQIDAQLRRQLRDTAPTDTLGKKQTNPLSEFVPEIREAVMKDVDAGVDPNLAFNNRYVEWGEKLDSANEVLGEAFDKAKRAGSGLLKGREDAVKSMRASITELEKQGISVEEQRRFAKAAKKDMQLFNEAAQGMASGRVSRPGAQQPAASSAPATPKTRAEVEALPSGARFVNPADGRILVKK